MSSDSYSYSEFCRSLGNEVRQHALYCADAPVRLDCSRPLTWRSAEQTSIEPVRGCGLEALEAQRIQVSAHGAVGRTETHVKQSQRMSWAISSRFTSFSSVGRVPPCGEKETLGSAGERFLLLYSRLGSHISRLGSIKSYLILVGPHEEVQCSAHQAGFVIGCDGVVHRKAEQWLPW